ncbi:MAG: NAD(+)/NADH kinase [Pseudomonadota bacterium]|nr:NAD(+)/NADH kinase [Pseudomonadota bacterium]
MKIGLLVNPVAGLGGAVGLKGSDGSALQNQARLREGSGRAPSRVGVFLEHLREIDEKEPAGANTVAPQTQWITWSGAMGADYLAQHGFSHTVLGSYQGKSAAADTVAAVTAYIQQGVDLVVFVGGDGTARDVLGAATEATTFLGLPAGVKMHSGVFAISPMAAARVVSALAQGRVVSRVQREVRDYVEAEASADADAIIRTRAYGELWVPEANDLLQQTKVGGKESDALAITEIASYVTENWPNETAEALILGPGSSCMQIKQAFGMPGTLLGVDVLMPDGSHLLDASAQQLLSVVRSNPTKVFLSFTRQQAFLFGRGNQQLTPQVLKCLQWPTDFIVISSRNKLLALEQRPLLVDCDDPTLDALYSGLVEVLTGYDERSLYRVASAS